MSLNDEIDKRIKELSEQFQKNKQQAEVFVKQKNFVEQKLQELVNSGSMIAAKIAALTDLREE